MFIGTTGIQRVVTRTCQVMKDLKTEEPDKIRKAGAIDLQTIQRYLNFHFSVSLDLFGQELSTNAANYYTAGLKGRFEESKNEDDHLLTGGTYNVTLFENDQVKETEQDKLLAVNERLRDDYIVDCQIGVTRWNKIIKKAGFDFALTLPHRGFNRHPAFERVAAFHAGSGIRPLADDHGDDRARQVRRLGRPARPRHRRPSARFRVCPVPLSVNTHRHAKGGPKNPGAALFTG